MAPAEESGPPADVRPEPGYTSKSWNISRYTALAYTPGNPNPESKIVEWIFRRTGSADWHGEKVAILSASRTTLRAYHSPKMLKKVDDVVKRFNKAVADKLTLHVRFVRAADTRWRYLVHSRMTPVGSGPQGQQIWTLNANDAASLQSQMQLYRGFETILDRKIKVVNGQTIEIDESQADRLHRRRPARRHRRPRLPAVHGAAQGGRDPADVAPAEVRGGLAGAGPGPPHEHRPTAHQDVDPHPPRGRPQRHADQRPGGLRDPAGRANRQLGRSGRRW